MALHQALKAEPNLTPILDMVFQLITFFMLVINFKAASLDMSVQLPVIGSALPTEAGDRDVLVLNVMPNGKLRQYGEEWEAETLSGQRGARARADRRKGRWPRSCRPRSSSAPIAPRPITISIM